MRYTAESAHAMHIHFEEKMIFKLIPFLHNVHQFTWRTGGELALPADFDCLAMLIALSNRIYCRQCHIFFHFCRFVALFLKAELMSLYQSNVKI